MNLLRSLLAEKSDYDLAQQANRAQQITRQHFGHNIELYAPLYLSNYCANRCTYCDFRADNLIARTKLADSQVHLEAKALKQLGIEHVLIVTGEHAKYANIDDFCRWLIILKHYFHSVSIECQQLTRREYEKLSALGLDGVYLYQETYLEDDYLACHLAGKKRRYSRRINAPRDMLDAGVRKIGLGILLGLHDNWREDAYRLLTHANSLKARHSELSISLPRLTNSKMLGDLTQSTKILLQIISAARLYLPSIAISLSTREPAWVRDLLLPYGITSASVASQTAPGGYHSPSDELAQFDIHDQRSIGEFSQAIKSLGLNPLLKNGQREVSSAEMPSNADTTHHHHLV